jgi:hypothetical protein
LIVVVVVDSPFFAFFLCFKFLLLFPLFSVWFFLLPFIPPLLFHLCFVPVFWLLGVSSLAYPNLLGTKRIGCCCI